MARAQWYTPQLKRKVVSKLYHRAKAEHVPMTVLANRIMEDALGAEAPTPPAEQNNRPK